VPGKWSWPIPCWQFGICDWEWQACPSSVPYRPTPACLPALTTSKLLRIPWTPLRWDIAPSWIPTPSALSSSLVSPHSLFPIPIQPMPIHMPGGRVALPTAHKSGMPRFHQLPGLRCRFQHFCIGMLLSVISQKRSCIFCIFVHGRSPHYPPPPPPAFLLRGIPKTIRLRNVESLGMFKFPHYTAERGKRGSPPTVLRGSLFEEGHPPRTFAF
jgi:hypothetical protein